MSPVVNPLVDAGLVSQALVDILATPSSDAVAKRRMKRIVGARELTANEYSEMLREDQRKKDQLAEEKKRKSKERERKKKEMEEKSSGSGTGPADPALAGPILN